MNFGTLEQLKCGPECEIARRYPASGLRAPPRAPCEPSHGRPCGPPNPGGKRPPMPRIMFFNMPPFIIFFMVFCM
jgi:hypothetical protein